MRDCSKCQRTDVKCCFICKKDANKCDVWHHCGSDCPEYESKIKTNADRIRSMTDKQMSTDLIPMIMEICEDGVPSEELFLEWLQSEAEQERE